MALITIMAAFITADVKAQTVDDILTSYFENTGGLKNWKSLDGIKINAKANQQGMEIPLEIVQLADGRQFTKITFQGNTIKQGVFDGETMWNTNFQTMKAEKADAESIENMKKEANDFPDPFLDYEEKGYSVELLGKEDFQGTETYKIKLVKEPKMMDGQQVEDISYYYFDTEALVPLGVESEIKQGQMKGKIQQITMSDYQEVEGLYFPFSMTQGLKNQEGQAMTVESIELNPEVEDSEFDFPNE